jgi:hypothetical protein
MRTSDCGDSLYWEEEEFCPNHFGCQKSIQDSTVPETLKKALLSVFRAASKNISFLLIHDYEALDHLLTWLDGFIATGDVVRSLVSTALNMTLFARPDFILVLATANQKLMTRILKFLGTLSNDANFRKDFGMSVTKGYARFVAIMMTACARKTSVDMEALKTFTRFAFNKDTVHSLISSGYNWSKLVSDVLPILVTHYASCGCESLVVDGMLDLHLAHLLLLIESASQCPNQ